MKIAEKFQRLGVDNAPGQECRQGDEQLEIRGEKLIGALVDFSHGDIDAHPPLPGSQDAFNQAIEEGGSQAYTEYRGKKAIRDNIAAKISNFISSKVDGDNIILTPGTQGALFLAMGACVMHGDKVAIVEPDYFANRKMVEFLDGEIMPIPMDYMGKTGEAGLSLKALEKAFIDGAKLFIFSNPNNPTGVVYSKAEVEGIAKLAKKYNVTLIVDELYSRQVYDSVTYTHLSTLEEVPDSLVTIIGPSKTESLSGYRLGIAYGASDIIERMEKLQAIMCLRCSGYNQAVFKTWFAEPEGWMANRLKEHQSIRDDIAAVLNTCEGVTFRLTDGGSYLFVNVPPLNVTLHQFIKIARAQANVIVTPGTEFGPQFTESFRINFSQDHKNAVAAMERIVKLIDLYRKK